MSQSYLTIAQLNDKSSARRQIGANRGWLRQADLTVRPLDFVHGFVASGRVRAQRMRNSFSSDYSAYYLIIQRPAALLLSAGPWGYETNDRWVFSIRYQRTTDEDRLHFGDLQCTANEIQS